MANSLLTALTAATDIATTDVLMIEGDVGGLNKITGANLKSDLESGGSLALSLAASQVAAAGADTRVQYNNGGSRGGDAEVVWDNSGKVLTVGAVTATTQVKLPSHSDQETPTIGFGNGDTGFWEATSNVVSVGLAGGRALGAFSTNGFQLDGDGSGPKLMNEASSSTNPTLLPNKSDTNTGVGSAAADQLSFVAGSVEVLRLSESTKDNAMIHVSNITRFGDNFLKAEIRGRKSAEGWFFDNGFGMFVDETNDKLEFWALYSDGTTVKKHELGLA